MYNDHFTGILKFKDILVGERRKRRRGVEKAKDSSMHAFIYTCRASAMCQKLFQELKMQL